jgi:tRNA G37 N-methylase Trm5
MNKKSELGQFFTTNSKYITQSLLSVFEEDDTVVDPFAGNWDLLNLIKDKCTKVEAYDIDPKNTLTEKRDSLLNPCSYSNKKILTNPPYLARNKFNDKTIFDVYATDDLYKAALKSISSSDGGVIILPLNFLSSSDDSTRKEFLNLFKITKMNIFEEQVFDDTSYTVCAFSFVRKTSRMKKFSFKATIFPSKEKIDIILNEEHSYRVGEDYFNDLAAGEQIKISRLREGAVSNSNLFLRALDSGSNSGRISLSVADKPFFGKNTDRAFATLVLPVELTIKQQQDIADRFNLKLEEYRKQYNSLFLSQFRNSTASGARKRISFDEAYALVGSVLIELGHIKGK